MTVQVSFPETFFHPNAEIIYLFCWTLLVLDLHQSSVCLCSVLLGTTRKWFISSREKYKILRTSNPKLERESFVMRTLLLNSAMILTTVGQNEKIVQWIFTGRLKGQGWLQCMVQALLLEWENQWKLAVMNFHMLFSKYKLWCWEKWGAFFLSAGTCSNWKILATLRNQCKSYFKDISHRSHYSVDLKFISQFDTENSKFSM